MKYPSSVRLGLAALALCLMGAQPSVPSGQPGEPVRFVHMEHLKLIALDPGHGGSNKGCLGVDGTYEKYVTLDIAKRVEKLLHERTNSVALLTRKTDSPVGLRERTKLANHWGADVFLSIHLNADPYGAGFGVETWFLSPGDSSEEAKKLVAAEEGHYHESGHHEPSQGNVVDHIVADAQHRAALAASETLADSIVRHLHLTTGARFRGVKQARFGVLVEAKMPAIVVECGFFSHRDEGTQLVDTAYLDKVARGIFEGLIAYDRQIGGRRTARSEHL